MELLGTPAIISKMITVRVRVILTVRVLEQYQGHYEAGRLYGRLEVLRQCTEHGGPRTFFRCCFISIWLLTISQQCQNVLRGTSHGGCWAKVAISAKGVHGRTNISSAQTQHACSKKTNHTASCALTRPTKSLDQLFYLCIFYPYPKGFRVNPNYPKP